jgi:upstream activation factor subunit UAF30
MVAKNKVKKVDSKKQVKPVVEPVVEPVVDPVVEPVVEQKVSDVLASPDTPDVGASYSADFEELHKMADTFLSMARLFKTKVKDLEKNVAREHKVLEKKTRGKRRRAANADGQPSGFAKPGPVSDELRKFLNLGKDDLIARTEVTKGINKYCKEHSLQNEADKRQIMADQPLRKLLKMKKSDNLTFFNLQTYLKIHFPNKEGVYQTS